MIKIGKRKIGENLKPLIICELGINHSGSLVDAKKMVDLAFKNGAEAIKNQSHILEKEMIPASRKVVPANANKSIYNVIKENMMSFEDEIKLKKYVEEKNDIFEHSFSIEAAIKLKKIGIKAFKIGSGSVTTRHCWKKLRVLKNQ